MRNGSGSSHGLQRPENVGDAKPPEPERRKHGIGWWILMTLLALVVLYSLILGINCQVAYEGVGCPP